MNGIATVRHPATFHTLLLAEIDRLLGDAQTVLDPFAGTGRIHELATEHRLTFGVEIEPEWAALHPLTTLGSALALPWSDATFDAIATSPTYGNRMADTYDGRDGSKRATYRTALGHELHEDNSGGMQWGKQYRAFHRIAWREAVRVLKPDGLFILNCKDHIRKGVRQHVTDWHIETLEELGLTVTDRNRIGTPGNRYGANSQTRINYEEVIRLTN